MSVIVPNHIIHAKRHLASHLKHIKCLSGHIEQPLRCLTICFCGQGIIYNIIFCFGGVMYPMEYIMSIIMPKHINCAAPHKKVIEASNHRYSWSRNLTVTLDFVFGVLHSLLYGINYALQNTDSMLKYISCPKIIIRPHRTVIETF